MEVIIEIAKNIGILAGIMTGTTAIVIGITKVYMYFLGNHIKEIKNNKTKINELEKGVINLECNVDLLDTNVKQINSNLMVLIDSNLAIVRSEINRNCEKYMEGGYLTQDARYCLEELFKNYKELGGNHGVERLVHKCYELPPKFKK